MKTIEQTPFEFTEMEERILNNPTIYSKARKRAYIILKHMHEEMVRYAVNKRAFNINEFIISVNDVLAEQELKSIGSIQTVYNYKKQLSDFKLVEEIYNDYYGGN